MKVQRPIEIFLPCLLIASVRSSFNKSALFKECTDREGTFTSVIDTVLSYSTIACGAMCLQNKNCNAANFRNGEDVCVLSDTMGTQQECKQLVRTPGTNYILLNEPNCIHGGQWSDVTSSCGTCDLGYAGRTCNRRVRDCTEAVSNGQTISGDERYHLLQIQPLSYLTPLWVKCYFDWGGWTVLEERGAGYESCSQSFNRDWSDYKNGFGNTSSPQNCEHFIGLEHLHVLTSQGQYTLDLVFFNATWVDKHAYYTNFSIDSEANHYAMHYSSSVGNLADGFTNGLPGSSGSPNGRPFCTSDSDYFKCAQNTQSGWWFDIGCSGVNLHIPLKPDGTTFIWPAHDLLSNTSYPILYMQMQNDFYFD